jgi:hypothetical protein
VAEVYERGRQAGPDEEILEGVVAGEGIGLAVLANSRADSPSAQVNPME